MHHEEAKKTCGCPKCENGTCNCAGAEVKAAGGCCCGPECKCGPDCACPPSCGCPGAKG